MGGRVPDRLLREAARNLKPWLTGSPFESYRDALIDLVRQGKFAELNDLFWEVIPFGTGGRRGRMAALGHRHDQRADDCRVGFWPGCLPPQGQRSGGRPSGRGVRHASPIGRVRTAHGNDPGRERPQSFLVRRPRADTELSFAVRHLNCDVGAMISASHNPPSDNGFKAYWSTGGQVLPPHDRGIVDCVAEAGEIPAVDFQSGGGPRLDRARR